ncbi:MAG TPA: DNA translocase FtsK 4TM domain-containing protein [Luteolibacter sp.]|nr:DNA translocase FtsK 4TM domain-containing protein [Luteolibacter sp.]
MANGGNKKRGELPEPGKWSNEIVGIVLIGLGLVLLLALVSYSPSDLPRKWFFEAFADKDHGNGTNLIGPVGGILGFIQIILFGAASYLLPVALIWFGVVKVAFDGRLWPKPLSGFAVLLVSAATFLAASGIFFDEWAARCHIPGPGGVVGNLLGGVDPDGNAFGLLTMIVARSGTILISLTAYLVALLLLTGQHPIRFVKRCYRIAKIRHAEWNERRSEQGKTSAREAEMLAERERQREQRRKDRESAKAAADARVPEPDPQPMLGLRETPTPQIIDASQRRSAEPVVPGTKPFERKKPAGHQFLSVDGFEDYELPGFDLLDAVEHDETPTNHEEMLETQRTIVDTLKAFGIDVSPGDITRGPTITRYEIYPSTGLRVSRISQLEADLARATRAERINILAPIPGKDTVGIEIANSQKVAVPLHELLHDPEFRSAKKKIPLALGKDVYGKTVIGDLAAMPHLLVAGATGSGKSVCINSIIASMLFKFGPDELRFIMVDPKVVEMQMYNKLPHLIVPVVTDPKKTVAALKWVVNEMEKRYRMFAKEGVRNFDSFNNRPRPDKAEVPKEEEEEPESDEVTLSDEDLDAIVTSLGEGDLAPEADDDELEIAEEQIPDRFPYIVVLIDELADLMQTAPADVEMCIARIAQKARAAGIHLIIATQTPRADVVTGIIKANIPCRIAFQVSSALDSRVILDTKGADKLVGKGDMLFLPPGSAKLERSQGAFVSDAEVERIVEHCGKQGSPKFETDIQASINGADDDEVEEVSDADEELIMKCIEVVRQERKASTSLLQRRLRLGYTRAARMVDILEQRGVVGPGEGAKPREVYLK